MTTIARFSATSRAARTSFRWSRRPRSGGSRAYFRREWSYAIDRVRNMADGALFILPVSIDATTAADALVPDKFKALHFTHLPGGEVAADFAQRLTDFMRARQL